MRVRAVENMSSAGIVASISSQLLLDIPVTLKGRYPLVRPIDREIKAG